MAVFDLDGTLLDSDAALIAPFRTLGVPEEEITFGHLLVDECERLGIGLQDYLDAYDITAAQPFPGVADLLARLDRWAVCSNKHPVGGHPELERLGWEPEVALFADAFGGRSKTLGPVLEALGVAGADVVFVGDTDHDRRCAAEAGARFAMACWNPRAVAEPGDLALHHPLDLLAHLEV